MWGSIRMIAIKEMEMPKSCFQCDFYSGEYGCRLKFTEECNPSVEKPDDCPLIEIVTCKDCKHNAYETKIKGDESIRIFCRKNKTYRCIDGFCSDGKRRE